ncbi:MAG: tRNA 2-selenouridine(34) synthase MnmH [Pseudomonadales bacterium]|nr:tRNA 2-selenouridine(34) synthase MnmH [Pseudomonadales bacterium]
MVASIADHAAILRDNTPVLDVRAPVEYARGSLPNSVNVPLLTDNERAEVGIRYKQSGNESAVALGYDLVKGSTKHQRIEAWSRFIQSHPDALVTCWRGGQRSAIAQQWLADIGVEVPRIAGGFKAVRQCSLDVFEQSGSRRWIVIAGSTGVGKTLLLNDYRESVDLEAIAHHRGSAFGQLDTPQPVPISFELALAQRLLQTQCFPTCLIEDESRTIGRLALPNALFEAMQTAPIVVLEAPFEERVTLTYHQYVHDANPSNLTAALGRIQKRLGFERYSVLENQLNQAIETKSESRHLIWIANLLNWYYDPMYEYQLSRKRARIVFRGNAESIREYLADKSQLRS